MPVTLQGSDSTDFPLESLYELSLAIHFPSKPTLLRHPITQTLMYSAGIFNLLSIAYSNWPRLR